MPPEQPPKFKIGERVSISEEGKGYFLRVMYLQAYRLKELPSVLTIAKLVTNSGDPEHWYETEELKGVHIPERKLKRYCRLARSKNVEGSS